MRPERMLPTLRHQLPTWYAADPTPLIEAADAYDRRHQARATKVESVLGQLGAHDKERAKCFDSMLFEVRRNRFVAPEGGSMPDVNPRLDDERSLEARWRMSSPRQRSPRAGGASPRRRQQPWRLDESVWWPRRLWCEAGDVCDAAAHVQRDAVEIDWRHATRLRGLAAFILNPGATDPPVVTDADADANADVTDEAEAVRAVRGVLHEQAALVQATFAYYACSNPMASVFHLSQQAWLTLVKDVAMALPKSSDCTRAHLVTLFESLGKEKAAATLRLSKSIGGGAGGGARKWDATGGALSRHEFVCLLVRAAIARYVLSGDVRDVSEAVRRLLRDVIAPKLAPMAAEDADAFRRKCCYVEPTDAVLRKHEEALRAMFERYAGEEGAPGEGAPGEVAPGEVAPLLMRFVEWKEFCIDLHLVDDHLTLRDATLCFALSRMRVADEHTERGWQRTTTLSFEDFLEAFVRLSMRKSLPTDAELRASGCSDAGQMLLQMEEADPARHKQWCAQHAVAWGAEPPQPPCRCVEHLVMLMIRTVEKGTRRSPEDVK